VRTAIIIGVVITLMIKAVRTSGTSVYFNENTRRFPIPVFILAAERT
jgi:hypothetical protein